MVKQVTQRDSIRERLTRYWPLVFLFSIWVAFAGPYLFKGRVPFPSSYLVTFFPPWNATHGEPVKNSAMPDVITQLFPWKMLTIETWKKGEIPLWNPYSFSGSAHAANYQSAVFSPMNLIFFILPFIEAWSLSVLLQPVLASIGMYGMLRALGLRRSACVLGSISFMFCGFMTVWMAYGTLGYAALFLPWAGFAVFSNTKRPSIAYKVLLSVTVALSFLSGHFQISLYVAACVLALIVSEMARTRNLREGIWLILYAIFGLLLAAPQLLLTLDAYQASERSVSFIKGEIIPWQYLVTLLSPDFFGNPVTRNDWFGHYAEWASYIGVVPLFLSALALSSMRDTRKYVFVSVAGVSLLLAYPTPLADGLFSLKLPVLSTSAASRIMILFSFSLAALAAFGFHELQDMWKSLKKWRFVCCVAVLLVLLAGIWVGLLVGMPFSADKLLIAKRNLMLPTAFVIAGAVAGMLGFIGKNGLRNVVVLTVLLLAAIDSYRFASKWMPFDSRSNMYPGVPSLEFLQKNIGVNRVFGNMGNESAGVYHLPLIEGYDAVYQGRYGQFIQAVSKGVPAPGARSVVQFDKNGKFKTEALQLLGVKYIYHRKSDGKNVWAFPYWEYTQQGSMRQAYSDNDYWIYEYRDAYPRAFLASSYSVVKSDNEAIANLFAPETNRRETLILDRQPGIAPQAGNGEARITAYDSGRVVIHTDSAVPKLAFLSDVFDPGWKATVDGRPAPVLRADFDFRAVAVPAGQHDVVFTYAPDAMKKGLIGVFVAVFGMLLGAFVYHKYEHRHI